MVSLGVDPVPSSSSTSILERLRTTLREGVGSVAMPPPLSALEEEEERVKERDARDAERGGGISEDKPVYSISSSSRERRPILAY